MDSSILIAVVTVLLIVAGALVLNWEIQRQARKDAAAKPASDTAVSDSSKKAA